MVTGPRGDWATTDSSGLVMTLVRGSTPTVDENAMPVTVCPRTVTHENQQHHRQAYPVKPSHRRLPNTFPSFHNAAGKQRLLDEM